MKTDICFLQETHGTTEVEHIWANEWGGKVLFSNGTNNARGVAILIKPKLDLEIVDTYSDNMGRIFLLKAKIQNTLFNLLNIYAPNGEEQQAPFYHSLKKTLRSKINYQENILLGGDMNVLMDIAKDRKGGNFTPTRRYHTVLNTIHDMMEEADLNDVWRTKNPNVRRYTWRQHTPPIHSRLDYWLISNALYDAVEHVDIIPGKRTDHSAILLKLNSCPQQTKGRGFWRLNNSYLNEEDYVKGIMNNLQTWIADCEDLGDTRVTWEYIKYKIKGFSISYGKEKARRLSNRENELENELKYLEEKLDSATDQEQIANTQQQINNVKIEMEEIDDYKTHGLILRSRCRWYEKGEKSNDYFLRLESRNRVKKTMNKLQRSDGTMTTDAKEILRMQSNFYKELYANKQERNKREISEYLHKITTPILNEESKAQCEGELTVEECAKALKTFKHNKAPGNDGLTTEFYQKFWPILGIHLVKSFNASYRGGELTHSQKQAVITLLDKGKDRALLKNWRPISLLNTDYKIASKALSNRLVDLLPELIHHNQVGYVKQRNISENIRTIADLLEYTKKKHMPGILMCIDFQKAFDSLNWAFLELTLKKFNFGDSFIHWIQTLYNGTSSCVTNNGVASEYFSLGRGVRQGDPLSPYLFILAVEILANKIRQENKIKGITIKGQDIKLLQYADDTTGTLKDKQSAKYFLATVEEFGVFSGLKLNKEKTEAMWIGSKEHEKSQPFGISWPKRPLRMLGVHFSYDEATCNKLNFEDRIRKCKQIVGMWQGRNLTMQGRIQIIKTFIISQFLYIASSIHVPIKYIDEINGIIFKFIWKNKRERLKRCLLHKDKEVGGLNVPDFTLMIKATRLGWLKKYTTKSLHFWKVLFEEFIEMAGYNPRILFFANYDAKWMVPSQTLTHFHSEVLRVWSELGSFGTVTKDQCIWYNKNILIQRKPVFYKEFYELGISHFADLFNGNGSIIPFNEWVRNGLPQKHFLKWAGLVTAVRRNIYIDATLGKLELTYNNLLVENIPLHTITTKAIYTLLVKQKHGVQVASPRIKKYIDENDIDWKQVFKVTQMSTDVKTRDFRYRLINDILVNNYWLVKWKLEESNLCTFCGESVETSSHLFWNCMHVQAFWRDFETKFENLEIRLTQKDVLLGVMDKLVNTMICHGTRFIYECRYKEKIPTLAAYMPKIDYVKKVEFYIARNNNTVNNWEDKWEPLII